MKQLLEFIALNKEDQTKLLAILIPALLLGIVGIVDGLLKADLLLTAFAGSVMIAGLMVRADIIRRFRM